MKVLERPFAGSESDPVEREKPWRGRNRGEGETVVREKPW
jgi:hypothetical protein